MGNTKTLIKSLATGIPALADMVDNEIIWVEDSQVIYKRKDASTLLTNVPFTDAGVSANADVTANKAKVGYTDELVKDVIDDYGIGTTSTESSANSISSGDIQTLVKSGLYYVGNSVTNKPTSNGGHLIVNNNQSTSNNNILMHQFTPYDADAIYINRCVGGTGAGWVSVSLT